MTKQDRKRVEDSTFTCSICDAVIKNKDGYYIVWDKYKSIKVCKIHVADKKANREELNAYKFMEESK